MRTFFAQYISFLVAIATIALGAPLDSMTTTPILKRETSPVCPPDHPVYKYSHCERDVIMLVTCGETNNPDSTIEIQQGCESGICIEHLAGNDNTPNAVCMDVENTRTWNNFDDPSKDACSVKDSYETDNNIVIAMVTYSINGDLMKVSWLDAYINGNSLPMAYNVYSYSQMITNYNKEKIKYCFYGGSSNQNVVAFAAAYVLNNAFLSPA